MERKKHLHRIWLHFVHRFVPFSLNRCVSENSAFNMQMTRKIGLATVGTLIKKTSIYISYTCTWLIKHPQKKEKKEETEKKQVDI